MGNLLLPDASGVGEVAFLVEEWGVVAADVAVAAALISALKNEALPADTVFFGEIGLAGEVRPVTQADIRLKESEKLGFKKAIIPKPGKKADKEKDGKIILRPLTHIRELAEYLG